MPTVVSKVSPFIYLSFVSFLFIAVSSDNVEVEAASIITVTQRCERAEL